MRIKELILQSWDALARNRLRSILRKADVDVLVIRVGD